MGDSPGDSAGDSSSKVSDSPRDSFDDETEDLSKKRLRLLSTIPNAWRVSLGYIWGRDCVLDRSFCEKKNSTTQILLKGYLEKPMPKAHIATLIG